MSTFSSLILPLDHLTHIHHLLGPGTLASAFLVFRFISHTGPWGGALGKPGVLATSGGEEPAQLYFEFREGCYSLHFDSFSF